jgi:RNA polymerase-binding transcription factor DksA
LYNLLIRLKLLKEKIGCLDNIMKKFDDFLEEELKDKELKKLYDKMNDEYNEIQKEIDLKNIMKKLINIENRLDKLEKKQEENMEYIISILNDENDY